MQNPIQLYELEMGGFKPRPIEAKKVNTMPDMPLIYDEKKKEVLDRIKAREKAKQD